MRIFTDINVSKERGDYHPRHDLQALNLEKLGAVRRRCNQMFNHEWTQIKMTRLRWATARQANDE
jgi:hypothetical protein